jgi:fructosamine-3-kinase
VQIAAITRELGALAGVRCAPQPERRVGGGSINTCYAWRCETGLLFVKVAPREGSSAFTAESEGLAALGAAGALRVPRVLACGSTAKDAFLALEWLERGPAGERTEARLGQGLAALHRVTAAHFGFARDNFIGAARQANGQLASWPEFFRERRLRPQLARAVANGFGTLLGACGERLLEEIGALLAGHACAPSLLHGDLWGGNWLATADGEPAIFDPAVYYGDRETDLAMTQLFGGFGARFYRAYEEAAPLPPGAALRRDLYNLYHVLNHANLFGGGYAAQARTMIERLLAEAHR